MKKITYYGRSFSTLPRIINSEIGDGGSEFFCVCIDGQEVSAEAEDAYCDIMRTYGIPFSFYPFCRAFPDVNTAFGVENPLMDVRLRNGVHVGVVRQINHGIMFFNRKKLKGITVNDGLSSAFMEEYVDRLSSTGDLPSNGMFIDVYESWKLFKPYRRTPIALGRKYFEELNGMNINIDCDSSRLFKFLDSLSCKNREEIGK